MSSQQVGRVPVNEVVMDVVHGECYCGSIKFTAKLDKLNLTAYCHCKWCRKAHAAACYQVARLHAHGAWMERARSLRLCWRTLSVDTRL